ncbi:dTDP-4-amino-4,6-dideoxygalactose transaminase [Fundidesulfovibrio butyratiphilus]
MTYRIPFNRPCFAGNEHRYIQEAMASGKISGDGIFTKRAQALLEDRLGLSKALLTTSCTHALEMTALLLDLKPGDEVILPAFTFVSTANAYVLRGAKPVFADIRPDTLNIDESTLAGLVTERTKAVAVVHYAGVGCEMDAINALCRQRGLAVVEDNAHGLFAAYKGRMLGTLGDMSTLSFHETKNITCGEGGALCLPGPDLAQRAEILREKGTNRARFFRGEVDKYSWVDLGSSYVPSEVLAAFLFAQLERAEAIQKKRRAIWERYDAELADWAKRIGARRPVVPAHCDQSHHMYYLLMPSLESRTRLIEALKDKGMLAVFHYLPLHLSTMGRRFGGEPGQCPVCEDVSDRLVRLPFYNDLSDEEQGEVIAAMTGFGG